MITSLDFAPIREQENIENNRAIMQISVISGVLEAMRVLRYFSRVDIKRRLDSTIKHIAYAVSVWQNHQEYRIINAIQVKAWMTEWKEFAHNDGDGEYSAVIFSKMIERLATALDEVTRNSFKRHLLEPILETAKVLSDFTDPQGVHFAAYDRADELVGKLYEIIGMQEYV